MVLASQTPSDSALVPVSDAHTTWLWHCGKKKWPRPSGMSGNSEGDLEEAEPEQGASSVACDLFLHRPRAHAGTRQSRRGRWVINNDKGGKKKKNSIKQTAQRCMPTRLGLVSCLDTKRKRRQRACLFSSSNAYILIRSQRYNFCSDLIFGVFHLDSGFSETPFDFCLWILGLTAGYLPHRFSTKPGSRRFGELAYVWEASQWKGRTASSVVRI